MQRQYKDFMSDFSDWSQKPHAKEYLIFPENIGRHLSIDETCLAKDELYTILTNKDKKGKKESIVAIVAGTKVEIVIKAFDKIPETAKPQVEEITLDMANSMRLIAKKSFKNAVQVTDRFHFQKLALDALQDIRIKHRWEAIGKENNEIQKCKTDLKKLQSKLFENVNSSKKLLARSRYTLYKSQNKWTEKQKTRASILFREYPDIEQVYLLTQQLRNIFNHDCQKCS